MSLRRTWKLGGTGGRATRARFVTLALAALAGVLFAPQAVAAPAPIAWCGNETAATDRLPDRLAGSQFHVVYVVPSDAPDRFRERANAVASEINAIDAWWRREDPTRTPRFDLFPFPNCGTRLGQLDISSVRLPKDTAYYSGLAWSTRGQEIAATLRQPPYGFSTSYKRYVVFYDAPVDADLICGTGRPMAVIYIQSRGCIQDLGAGAIIGKVTAHEIVHNLGAAPIGAPHGCPGDPAHVCDSRFDILAVGGTGAPYLDQKILDVGRDDYYNHPGSWLDIRDSPLLSHLDTPPADVTLKALGGQITTPQHGGETVLCETPAGCTTEWEQGATVWLRARTSVPLTFFRAWQGVTCDSGLPSTECRFTVRGPATVTAVFSQPLRCIVPRLRGKTLAAAKAALARANCELGGIRRVRSLRVRRGYVIAQSLRPGTVRPLGTSVALVVSRGRR